MADPANSLIVEALGRALADPAGMPLHGGRKRPGLFAASAAAKKAARRCKDENWLQILRTHKQGRAEVEICAITEKGLAYLAGQLSPRQVIEQLVHAVEAHKQQVGALVVAVQQAQAGLEAFRVVAEKALHDIGNRDVMPVVANGKVERTNGSLTHAEPIEKDIATATLARLSDWRAGHPTEDCTLPELYRQLRQVTGELRIGEFHDGLRRLHEQGRIYLHPWTGPLYDMPDPALALMIGHEIAYYASIRQ